MTRALFIACLLGGGSAAAAPADDGLQQAPAPVVEGPAEGQLSPPPDADKFELPPGYIEIRNPAFPTPEVRSVTLHRGRAFDVADFAPYFAAGVRAQAKAEFDRGHYELARRLLEGQGASLPVRYLRALAASRGGDFAKAATEMSALASEYALLRDRCLTHAGLALEELKRWGEAAASYAQVPSDSRLFVDARLGLARSLHREKDLTGAIAALESLAGQGAPSWGRDVGAEALIAIADLAREKKDAAAEQDALRRLWAKHPLSPLSTQAEARLGGASKMPLDALVTRGEVLIDAHRNKQGLEVITPLLQKLALPDGLACRAHFAVGKGLRKERQHTKAIGVLSEVVQKCAEPELRPRALYVLGSSRSISELSRAPETYELLARDFPNHSFADDALFYAADVYAKLGESDKALARLKDVAERYPTGDFVAESLFKAFWIERDAKRLPQAMALLDQLEARFATADESYDLERARYWRARMLEGQGDVPGAVTLFEEVATQHPATYYGLMARTQLERLDPVARARVQKALRFPPGKSPWPLHAGAVGEDRHFLTGVELLRLGFPEAVSSEVLAVSRANQPAESLRLLVHVLSLAGDARAAHAIARVSLRRDLSGRITPENRAAWELAYPNAFRELIERHCKASKGLPPDLLQALMREESALDPKALSWAGALGLTQLMPATARGVAQQLKLRGVTVKQLLEPDLNIRLGATYLGNLAQRFRGTFHYALASYNAGTGAVERWRKDRPADALDEWVENIPIAETRGYVKRVLRSYNTYQLLYAPPLAEPSAKASAGGRATALGRAAPKAGASGAAASGRRAAARSARR